MEEKKYFKHVRRLDIITALEVTRYFTRLYPPGEIFRGDQNHRDDVICNIEVNGKTKFGQPFPKKDWLPCAIKKGEGVFMVFDENFIKSCMTGEMKKRLGSIIENHKDYEKISRWPPAVEIDEQYIFLHSMSQEQFLVLKADVNYEALEIQSVTGLWAAANWYEREVHDLFGVSFSGNSDLTPLLLYDEFVGHPGRKEYDFHEYQEF